MFDKLVESAKQTGERRTGRYFAITCAVYAVALLVLGVGTILTFSPVLAEEYSMIADLVPPPPPPGPLPAPVVHKQVQAVTATIFAPNPRPDVIPKPETIPAVITGLLRRFVDGGIPGGAGPLTGTGVIVSRNSSDPMPPPPPPPPPPPAPETTKPSGPSKVSEGVLTGGAIRKVKPAYPQIAKAARASGAVQVQVTISEEGRVMDAVVLTGNPLLRAAALDAARQWLFSPTMLSRVPVKVQGILTFNFTLE
jgi:protein TonB